jgi:hypothetical protein
MGMSQDAAQTITEQHHVIAGVIWLHHAPVRTVEHVRCAADPEAVWITLRPGRDYQIIDAESGQLYVSALVGTLVEVTYTIEQGPGTARPRGHQTTVGVASAYRGEHRHPLVTGGGNDNVPDAASRRRP